MAFIQKNLNRLEQLFKTDIRYLIRGGFWLSLAKTFALLSSLLTSVVFANFLPEETYGIYRYVLSILPLLAIPTLSGIDTALSRAVAKGFDGTMRPALKAKISWGLLGGLGSLALSGYYYLNGNPTLTMAFLMAAPFIPFLEPLVLFNAFLVGKKNFKLQAIYQGILKILAALTIIVTVFLTKDILIILAVFFLSYTLLRLFFSWRVLRRVDRRASADISAIPYGKHLTFINMFYTFATTLDKILIFHYIGSVVLAGYYLAFVPFKQAQGFLNNMNTLALPKFSTRSIQELKETLPKKILKAYLVVAPIVLIYYLIAPFAFSLIYPKYIEFVGLSQILMALLLFLPLTLMHTAITAHAGKRALYIHSITSSIFRVLFLIIFVPLYGIFGAVIAIFLTNVLRSGMSGYLFLRL